MMVTQFKNDGERFEVTMMSDGREITIASSDKPAPEFKAAMLAALDAAMQALLDKAGAYAEGGLRAQAELFKVTP